jgi:hypothetical protein
MSDHSTLGIMKPLDLNAVVPLFKSWQWSPDHWFFWRFFCCLTHRHMRLPRVWCPRRPCPGGSGHWPCSSPVFDWHRCRSSRHWWWHPVCAHHRRVFPVSPRLCARCRFAGGAGQRSGRRAIAAAGRAGEPASCTAAGAAGGHEFHFWSHAGPGHAGINSSDSAGCDCAGHRGADVHRKKI